MMTLRLVGSRFCAIVITIGVFSTTLAFAFQDQSEAKAKLNQAARAYNEANYDRALSLLEEARALDSTSSEINAYYGAALYAKYSMTGGEEYARRALAVYTQLFNEESRKPDPDGKLLKSASAYLAVINNALGDKEQYRKWMKVKADLPGATPQEKAEVYYGLGTSYWGESYEITQKYVVSDKGRMTWNIPDDEARRAWESASLGLETIEEALALNPEYADALAYKNLLWRELAKIEADPDARRRLLEEADQIRDQALEIMLHKQQEEGQTVSEEVTAGAFRPVPPPPMPQALVSSSTAPRRLSGGVLQGNAIRRVAPVYPAAARLEGVSGAVQVEIIINDAGDVVAARAISGDPLLQDAAVNAAWKWKFRPTLMEGKPISVAGTLVFNFRL